MYVCTCICVCVCVLFIERLNKYAILYIRVSVCVCVYIYNISFCISHQYIWITTVNNGWFTGPREIRTRFFFFFFSFFHLYNHSLRDLSVKLYFKANSLYFLAHVQSFSFVRSSPLSPFFSSLQFNFFFARSQLYVLTLSFFLSLSLSFFLSFSLPQVPLRTCTHSITSRDHVRC